VPRLPFLRCGGNPVARQGSRVISRSVFLSEIATLADQLPDRLYIVNLCSDRYGFSVALAAALLRSQVTLLPADGSPAAIAQLQADYPALYALTDAAEPADLPCLRLPYPTLAQGNHDKIPAFPPEQIAAVLFTSGSTGCPHPSPRRWGRLVAGSLAAGQALGIRRHSGAVVVATVPHAHSYGLESAVMLPLQNGLQLAATRPFFPADVAAALEVCDAPGILVTTPVHLRALVGDATTPNGQRAGLVLSATAPLPVELAARAEAAFAAPVFEIYGCSEAGQVAARRTIEGPVWRCLRGFGVRQDAAGTWVSGPDEDDVLLADHIEPINAQEFLLQGRTADLVNVAGKRSSLGYLTRQLTTIDGVEDGVFVMPEDANAGAPPRLAALVVAPGHTAGTILAALRSRIDPAFLPRPLLVVDRLPRDALGKLPRADILRLVALESAPSPEPATVQQTQLVLRFPLDHPAGPGHFPGNPVVPAAVLLDALASALFPDGYRSGEIVAAKFHHPVRPGETVVATCTNAAGTIRFECRVSDTRRLVLSGALRSTFPLR